MAPVRTAWPRSLATAALATLAACVRPTSMSVSVSPVKTVALARTGRTHTSVPAPEAPQVTLIPLTSKT